MGLFFSSKPGPGIKKDAPPAKGLRLFFQIIFREFFALIKVNFLFYAFCIPIVTIPAAYCAMTRITVTMVRDEPYFLWTNFWQTFRREFVKATVAGFFYLAGIALAVTAVMYYRQFLGSDDMVWLMFPVSLACAATLVFFGYSLFPMIALIDLPLGAIIKNAFLLIPLSFFRYILATVICAVLLALGYVFNPTSFFVIILLYPSLLNLITVLCAYPSIKKYIIGSDPHDDDGEGEVEGAGEATVADVVAVADGETGEAAVGDVVTVAVAVGDGREAAVAVADDYEGEVAVADSDSDGDGDVGASV